MKPIAAKQAVEFIDSWLGFHARNDTVPGFTVTIQHKKKIIFNKAYGLADVVSRAPLTTMHLYNAGSQAKMYTAVAIMQLVQQGIVSLDDSASMYIPWLANHKDPNFRHINIRQLLWHGAGLMRDGDQADYWQLFEPFPDKQRLQALVLGSALAVGRGETFKYSDLGYALLGEIVEAASGVPYSAYVQKNIIERLGLNDTFIDLSQRVKERLATSYSMAIQNQRLPLGASQAYAFASVAGIYMNTADACAFLAALLPGDERLLDDHAKRALLQDRRRHWSPQRGNEVDYGLGFMFAEMGNYCLMGHSGSFAGYCSAVFADPPSGLIVAVAGTAKDTPVFDMCFGIFDALNYFAEHAKKPLSARYQKYNVQLRNLWETIQIVATNNRIVAVDPDEWLPFTVGIRQLERINDATFKIINDGGLLSQAEYIRLKLKNRRVAEATYAGVTMVPEQDFIRWYKSKELQ